ncbi:MAG: hypothetical protein Q9180_006825 [Flavoplaca navasiana]
MFVDHYLDPIFPLTKRGDAKAIVKAKKSQANGNGDASGHNNETTNGTEHLEDGRSYLGAIVEVDEAIPLKRRSTTPMKPLVRTEDRKGNDMPESTTATTNGNSRPKNYSIVDGFDAIGGDKLMLQAARGKTVKELSRLWRYLGGNSPAEGRSRI